MDKITLQAVLLTAASKVMVKNNAGKSEYVIYNAEITTDGPFKGATVACAYTTKNAKGEVKELKHKGDEVALYGEIVNGKPLWEIGSERVENTADADILAMFAQVPQSAPTQAI